MLIDTDVLIWVMRGHAKAAAAVNAAPARGLSVVTFMELLQGARDQREVKAIKAFLAGLALRMLPLTETVGYRASIYMEEHVLSSGLGLADALVAATAVEANEPLLTANQKHYKAVTDLEIELFRP